MGLGSFWDPNEHPRGWHGRFAKKWKVSDALRGILDGFRPRTFQSDSQAGQYAFNQGHKNGPFSSVELTRLRKDWDEAQDHLRAADMDPQTKAFDDMMQAHMRPTAEGLIATKTFGPDALGLRPDQMRDGPGGITDLFGTVVGDKGYGAVHLGTDVTAGQHGPGKISMTILVPAGTKAAFPGQSPQDRGFFLDKEQPLLITRVDPDGMGGWRIAAVAEPHPGAGNSSVSQDLNPGRKGVGLTPEERAARLAEPSTMPTPAAPPAAPATEAVLRPESVQAPAVGRTGQQEAARVQRAQAGRQANVNEGNPPVQAPLPTPNPREAPAPPPAAGPPSPTGVPDRNEPVHSPSIGATGTEGKSASEIANKPPEPAPEAPPVLSPSEQGKTLKDAYMESGIESPAAGPHRAAFNRAYLNAKRENGHPEQALRDLETDIKRVEEKAAEQKHTPSDRPDMLTAEADAKSMNDLADLIATHYGLPRAGKKEEPPKSPVQRAGGPDEFLGEKKPGAREASKVSGAPSKAQTGLTTHEQAGSGPGTAGVGGRKEGAPETPAPRGSSGKTMEERKSPGTAAGKITHGRIEPGDRVLVKQNDKGEWVPATTKTGATPLEVTGRDGSSLVGKGPNGEEIKTRGERGHQTFIQHVEKAPKAPAAKKAAKATKAAEPNPESVLRQPGQENLTDREMRAADRKRNPGAQLSEAQKADIAEKAARADVRQKAAQEAPLSKARQESMPKFMKEGEDSTGIRKLAKDSDIPGDGGGLVGDAEARLKEGQSPDEVGKWLDGQADKLTGDAARDHSIKESDDLETKSRKREMVQEANANADKLRELADRVRGKGPEGQPASPSLEARQGADSAGVDRVLKAYNDIVARGDGHDRRVSIADIRAEVGGDLSRAELTRALREVGRGGSGHGGLLSRGVKPDARTEASGMDMGGEKVHFLQLPRPGEAGRGKETTPVPKEQPAKVAKAAAKAVPAAAPSADVVSATKKAYEDIVGRRGPEGDRKVSLQDIRQELELQHSFSRPEVDKALRELSRGGSEHGGLISPATGKPSTRETAGAMKMGGEDVHFLQLPRPGEAGRGGETTPNAPGEGGKTEQEIESRVRAVYADLRAEKPKGSNNLVNLADLRERLAEENIRGADVDMALKRLIEQPGVNLIPESNQSGLTPRLRSAAARIGGQDKHHILIGEPAAAEKPLDKMTKAELLAHPDAAGAKQSWTKAKIKEHIQAKQAVPAAAAPQAPPPVQIDLNDPRLGTDRLSRDIIEGISMHGDKPEDQVQHLIEDGMHPDQAKSYVDEIVALMKHRGLMPEGKAAGKPSTEDRIASKLLERMTPEARDRIMADMSPAERAAVEEAQRKVSAERMVPERALGRKAVRPTTPIDNEPRANEFTKAWDAAGIPEAPGSAGRSIKEIRKDLAEGKIDPAEGVRRMESEISFNKDELSQVDADLRAPDLTDKQRAELQAEHAKISEGIKAQEKASEFLRGHFGGQGDKPTVAEVKVHLPATFGDHLKTAKPEEMDEVARIQGLETPKGDTAEEKFNDLIRQTIDQALDEKKKAGADKAAKAEAARIKKEAREAGKAEFRPGGEKHLDAAKIAEGLDTGDIGQYVDDAQTELNDGKTPKQVADRVRFMARGLADTNAIIHGSRDSGRETPEDRAAREAELATGRAKVAKLTELADRIEGSKRPRKPRAPSTKLTPVDHAAAKEAATATGTPVAEVRSAMEDAKKADAKLQELGIPTSADELHARAIARASTPFNDAKTAEEARRAATRMHADLTLVEVRKMGAEHGITGRSKKDITDKLIARRFPAPPGADEPVTVREAGTPPTKFAIPRERLSGSQFKDRLKPGDQIDVHLGGGKTRRDTVESISPQGTMTTKGGYKYTTHSDVEVSKVESAAASAAPTKTAKKALPQPQASPRVALAALSNHENPPSREEAHAMVEHFTHADLQAMVKELGIPVTGSKSKENLRREIVDATVGRRLDSIATRGFQGDRPDSPGLPAKVAKAAVPAKKVAKPGPAAEPRLSPAAEKARLEQERADNMARLAAAKAVKKAAPAKAAPKKERFGEAAAEKQFGPQPGEARIEPGKFSDKPFRQQTWGGRATPTDLRYHESGAIGSALDMMGQDQRLDVGGEPLRNVLGQIATDVNRGSITPQQGLERYKALAARLPEGSKAKEALDRAIRDIDSPPRRPSLPEGTPPHIRKLAERLAEIPIARKEVGRTGRKGELEQVEALARELTNGEPKSIFTAHSALEKLIDNRHESASDAGYNQIIDAIREAMKEDDAARAAVRKARQAGGAGPKAEGGPAARRAAPGIESHRRDSAIQRAMKAILSRTPAGRQALHKVEAGPAPSTAAQEQEALRLVRGTQVRPALSMATTSRDVADVLARESEHLTGRPLKVDLAGLHPDVARGFAEGILRAQEAHPQADNLHSVIWAGTHDLAGAKPGWLAMAHPDGHIVFRRALDWQDMLDSYKEGNNAYGHRHGVGSTPRDIAIHEYAHMLAFGPQRAALERDAHLVLRAYHQASGSSDSLPYFVAQNISAYATENITETLAEAYTDVMVHGSRSSNLSQQLYRLILAYNPTRRP